MIPAPVISTPYLPLDLNSQNTVTGSRAARTLLPCSRVLLASLEPLAIPEAAQGDNEALVPLSMEAVHVPVHMGAVLGAVSHGAGDTRVSSSTATNKQALSAGRPQPTSRLPPALPPRHRLAQGPRHVSVCCPTQCGMPLGLSPWSHSPRSLLHWHLGASSR